MLYFNFLPGDSSDMDTNASHNTMVSFDFVPCRLAEEEEAKRKLDIEQRRRAEEEETKRKLDELEQRRQAEEEEKKRKLEEIRNRTEKAANSPKDYDTVPTSGNQGTGTSLQSAVNQMKNAAKNAFSTPGINSKRASRPTNIATESGPSPPNHHSMQGSSPSSLIRETTKDASKVKASKKSKKAISESAKKKKEEEKAKRLARRRSDRTKDLLDKKVHG